MFSRAGSSHLPKEALLSLVAPWLWTSAFGLVFFPAPSCVPPADERSQSKAPLFPPPAITIGSCFFCYLSLTTDSSRTCSNRTQHAHRAIKHWLRSEHQLPERPPDTIDGRLSSSEQWLVIKMRNKLWNDDPLLEYHQ